LDAVMSQPVNRRVQRLWCYRLAAQ
jgi:hypothetical protein